MYNAISVAFVCVLIDLLLRLLVGGTMVNAKMRSMFCLLADFLMCAHSERRILICLVVSHLYLRMLVPRMLRYLMLCLSIMCTNL